MFLLLINWIWSGSRKMYFDINSGSLKSVRKQWFFTFYRGPRMTKFAKLVEYCEKNNKSNNASEWIMTSSTTWSLFGGKTYGCTLGGELRTACREFVSLYQLGKFPKRDLCCNVSLVLRDLKNRDVGTLEERLEAWWQSNEEVVDCCWRSIPSDGD
jgi:hypothetical protein